jgi:hypothetical protein
VPETRDKILDSVASNGKMTNWKAVECIGSILIELELDYNVMVHAQYTSFVYGWNGRVYILLYQI